MRCLDWLLLAALPLLLLDSGPAQADIAPGAGKLPSISPAATS